jgi:hypothetical protein
MSAELAIGFHKFPAWFPSFFWLIFTRFPSGSTCYAPSFNWFLSGVPFLAIGFHLSYINTRLACNLFPLVSSLVFIFHPIDFQLPSISFRLLRIKFPMTYMHIARSCDWVLPLSANVRLTHNWIPLVSRLVSVILPIEFRPPLYQLPLYAPQIPRFCPAIPALSIGHALLPTGCFVL